MKARRKGKRSAFCRYWDRNWRSNFFRNGELYKGAHLYGGEFGLNFLSNGQTFSEIGTAVKMAQRYCERIGVEKNRR